MIRLCVRCRHSRYSHDKSVGCLAVLGETGLCGCLNYVRPAPRWLVRLNQWLSRRSA